MANRSRYDIGPERERQRLIKQRLHYRSQIIIIHTKKVKAASLYLYRELYDHGVVYEIRLAIA